MADQEPVLNKHLLYKAAIAFYHQVGLRVSLEKRVCERGWPLLRLEGHGLYSAYIKNWVPQADEAALVESILKQPKKTVLVADYVNPQLAERLRVQGIPFMDALGNLFFSDQSKQSLYLFIKGYKPKKREAPGLSGAEGRAFTVTGLQLLYYLMTDPNCLNGSYRKMAAAAGIATGSVGPILQDLKNQGFLIEHGLNPPASDKRRGSNGRALVDIPSLAKKWCEYYDAVLKKRKRVARFVIEDWAQLQQVQKRRLGSWGGCLQSDQAFQERDCYTLYLQKGASDLSSLEALSDELNLKRSPHGALDVVEAFWSREHGHAPHPLITYSDMLSEGVSRDDGCMTAAWQEVMIKLGGKAG